MVTCVPLSRMRQSRKAAWRRGGEGQAGREIAYLRGLSRLWKEQEPALEGLRYAGSREKARLVGDGKSS